ncbi:BAHD acyltransferase At5g47980-like [Syzygium oleosum]|uniref:BAHD acyltransferase At5g47980-like n=1 Tax=Syzygium oleosum TaxID=219896 RepID=UPI0024BA8C59|nr:BAHD acyltransferase At5g47980-like [Syzygium oleosum]
MRKEQEDLRISAYTSLSLNMTIELKVEVVAKETIRPSSPTPDHLKNFNFSVFDQLSPILYTSVLLFYTSHASASSPRHRSSHLKSSLSKALARFYPLAGRIRDNLYIDCDDGGAEFVDAKVNCHISHILDRPCPVSLCKLLPIDTESPEASTGRLLLVQANAFGCGGLAVGICVSHKIADASTLTTFIKAWSAAAHLGDAIVGIEIPPLDMASARFPPLVELAAISAMVVLPKARCVTRRYVLDPAKITPLAASEAVPEPTQVEAVAALVWRRVACASRKNNPGRQSLLSQAVNLRGRLPEPLPQTTVGNFVGGFKVEIPSQAEEREMELKKLVSDMREAKREYFDNYTPRLTGGEASCMTIVEAATKFGTLINSGAVDFYNCSSWCGFGLYKAADFGWGTPAWVSSVGVEYKNSIVLVDARGGGMIEVWLTLSQADMDSLDADEELLRFASLNPSVSGSCIA